MKDGCWSSRIEKDANALYGDLACSHNPDFSDHLGHTTSCLTTCSNMLWMIRQVSTEVRHERRLLVFPHREGRQRSRWRSGMFSKP
ncbi:hypothetical protein AOLI_G00131380 [Acnodon oligacanthus]